MSLESWEASCLPWVDEVTESTKIAVLSPIKTFTKDSFENVLTTY